MSSSPVSGSSDDHVEESINGSLQGAPQARLDRDRGGFNGPETQISQFMEDARNGLNALDARQPGFREHYKHSDLEQAGDDGSENDIEHDSVVAAEPARATIRNDNDSVSTPDDPPSLRVSPLSGIHR